MSSVNVATLLARVVFAQHMLTASEDNAGKQRRYIHGLERQAFLIRLRDSASEK